MTRHDDPGRDRRPASELDRVLGDWLADGPRRAPAAPVTVAIEFARAHPRRPDPLRVFRRDPMAGRGSARFIVQPAFALLLVGLLLMVVVGVGVVSGLRSDRSAPVPSPVAPIPSASPVASPTALPSPTPHVFDVTLDIGISQPVTITIEDHSNRIVRAEDVSAQGSAPMPAGDLTVTQVDATTVDVTWVDLPCQTRARLTLDQAATALVLSAAPCGGDTVAIGRAVRLVFDGPVDAASIGTATDIAAASPTSSPNIIALTLDTESATTDFVTFEDRSLHVVEIEDVSTTSRGEPGENGAPGVTQVDDTTIDLLWVAGPCDGARWGFMLDPTATALAFTPGAPCGGDSLGLTRAIRVRFDGAVDASTIRVAVQG